MDGADHLTAVNSAAVTSDANGNVTQDETGGAYTWDVRGRLVGLTKGGKTYAFQYGPDGLRLNKSVSGVLTTYLLDGSQVVTDTIGGTAYQTLYGPGTDHPLARNGEFFLPNSLGSTALLTDGSGNSKQSYQYSPFGGLLNSPTDNNPFQFTGHQDGLARQSGGKPHALQNGLGGNRIALTKAQSEEDRRSRSVKAEGKESSDDERRAPGYHLPPSTGCTRDKARRDIAPGGRLGGQPPGRR